MGQVGAKVARPQPAVLIVTVNYRTAALAIELLQSLESEVTATPRVRAIVVDNCSGDGSAEQIEDAILKHHWEAWARLVRAPINGGFAYGNNFAMTRSLAAGFVPDYVWFLNSDCKARRGALGSLVSFMAANPLVGIAGSSIENAEGVKWPYAFRFPSLWSELDQGMRLGFLSHLLRERTVARVMAAIPARVDWLSGASILVRRDVFQSIGQMDEGYFLYFEETDFSLAAQRSGWESWYVPSSRVAHYFGASTGVTSSDSAGRRLPQYWFESRRRYFVKNHGRAYAACADLLWILGFVSWRIRCALSGRSDVYPARILNDVVRNSALFHSGVPCNARLPQADPSAPVVTNH